MKKINELTHDGDHHDVSGSSVSWRETYPMKLTSFQAVELLDKLKISSDIISYLPELQLTKVVDAE